MKSLENIIENLLSLILHYQPKQIDENKRQTKIVRGLNLFHNIKFSKIHISLDLPSTYHSFRTAIPAVTWENWVIRKFCYNLYKFQRKKSVTKLIHRDFLKYIKNILPIPQNIEDFPLHRSVIERKLYRIRQICIGEDVNFFYVHIDQPDFLGNSALMLAVKLKYYDEVQVLIDHGADAKYRANCGNPSPIEQAIAYHDKTLLSKLVIGYHRDLHSNWGEHIQDFSETLSGIPDFSINMSWECVSRYIPFVKKFTPSDEYFICKKGNSLKIDLSLIGWEQLRAKRGKVSLLFNGNFNKIILIDHLKQTSRELFNEPSIEQVEKHVDVRCIQELLKDKKVSGDMVFHDCSIKNKKNWRGNEQFKTINGYHCKKYEIACGMAVSVTKRQILLEKEIQNIRSFEDYSRLCASSLRSIQVLSSKVEKNSNKTIKASAWCSQEFPLKISDLAPLLELLASVSHKAKRFHELLSSNDLFKEIGFPLSCKIPLVLTVTALVEFRNLRVGDIEDIEFEDEYKIARGMFAIFETLSQSDSFNEAEYLEMKDAESTGKTIVGPRLDLLQTPQLEDEEIEATFVHDFVTIADEMKLKLRTLHSHSRILGKIKVFIDEGVKESNDVDVIL